MRKEPKHITDLRQLAKKHSQKNHITHCQALDEIAKTMGYQCWARLIEKENVQHNTTNTPH